MGKNQLVVASKKQFNDVPTIVNSEANRAKLQTFIDEVVKCKTKILDENESIKGLREAAVDELGIEPKMFNILVSLHFNNNFEQKREEIAKIDDAINALMGSGDE